MSPSFSAISLNASIVLDDDEYGEQEEGGVDEEQEGVCLL